MKLLPQIFTLVVIYNIREIRGQLSPTNFVCSSSNSTTLRYDWVRPTDPSNQVQGYHLNIERTDGLIVEVIPQVTMTDKMVQTYTVYGTGKYAEYTGKLRSYTASGNQAEISVVCRTLTDTPSGAPTSVNATGISYSEIDVEWNAIGDVYKNGVLLGYKIVYFAMDNEKPRTETVSNTTFQYTISGLNFDTEYVVSVKGYTSAGDGTQTTDVNRTLGGLTTQATTETKYFCYEAVPGVIEIGWVGMPCTIYVIAIGVFFFFTIFFLVCCCCKGGDVPDKDPMPNYMNNMIMPVQENHYFRERRPPPEKAPVTSRDCVVVINNKKKTKTTRYSDSSDTDTTETESDDSSDSRKTKKSKKSRVSKSTTVTAVNSDDKQVPGLVDLDWDDEDDDNDDDPIEAGNNPPDDDDFF